jgi:uncharacterized protein YrrD
MEDLGRRIAHLALKDGTPVYSPGGERIGVVDTAVTDQDDRIFEGVLIHTLPLPGRHLYARHDQIAELRERGVLLAVERDALEPVDERAARRSSASETLEHPLEARLRRMLDWVNRRRQRARVR